MDTRQPQNDAKKLERAKAKAEYKELSKEIHQDSDLAGRLKTVKNSLTRADELYSKVKKNLGGSAADAKFIRETVELASRTSKLININTKPFEIRNIIKKIKRDKGTDFKKFVTNHYCASTLRMAPTFRFFYGIIKTENLIITKRKRRVHERIVETKAITATERNIKVDMQDSTPKEVEHIYSEIRKIAKNKNNTVPFFETLVDPDSFSQTVENIFHASFLVKEGQLGLKPDKEKKVVLTVGKEKNNQVEGTQSIFSFSMKDYKNWISSHKIKQRAFNPRVDDINDRN